MRNNPPATGAVAILGAMVLLGSLQGPGAVADEPSSVEGAQALLLAGEAESAASMYAAVLSRHPTDPEALTGRIRALIRLDRWEDALEEARDFRSRSDDPRVAGALGAALIRAGRLSEADAVLEAAINALPSTDDLDTSTGRLRIAYARLLAAQGDATAETVATQAVEAAPDDRDVLLWASELTGDRALTLKRLSRYLALADGDDADRVAAATETHRFLKSIGDRKFWVPIQRPRRIELPLRPVPGTGGPSGYTIDIVGGPKNRKVKLLLDTGSTGLFLVERAAKRLGLVTLDEQTVFGGGGNQRHRSQRGVLPTAAFGDLQFKDALVSTSSRSIHPTGAYQGVISLTAFTGYRVTLDLKARQLVLELPDEATLPTALPANATPYWIIANQWVVEAHAGNAAGLFLLDTGASSTVLAATLVPSIEGARLGGPAISRGYGGARSGGRWLHGAQVTFQGRTSPGRPLQVLDFSLRSRLGGVELGGFMGLDILDGTRLILDTARRRVFIEQGEQLKP